MTLGHLCQNGSFHEDKLRSSSVASYIQARSSLQAFRGYPFIIIVVYTDSVLVLESRRGDKKSAKNNVALGKGMQKKRLCNSTTI